MSKTSSRNLEVQLMVDHSSMPHREIERILGLPPDEAWDVGQSYRPSSTSRVQRYQFSRWAIGVVAASLNELPDALHQLVLRVQHLEESFRRLPSETSVSLTLFVTETDSVLGMGIEPEVVGFLARIGAGIEISIVVSPQAELK